MKHIIYNFAVLLQSVLGHKAHGFIENLILNADNPSVCCVLMVQLIGTCEEVLQENTRRGSPIDSDQKKRLLTQMWEGVIDLFDYTTPYEALSMIMWFLDRYKCGDRYRCRDFAFYGYPPDWVFEILMEKQSIRKEVIIDLQIYTQTASEQEREVNRVKFETLADQLGQMYLQDLDKYGQDLVILINQVESQSLWELKSELICCFGWTESNFELGSYNSRPRKNDDPNPTGPAHLESTGKGKKNGGGSGWTPSGVHNGTE